MDDKKAQSGPFGPAAIAHFWTANGWESSRQYADKCIRKHGCPTDTLQNALKWRTLRTGRRNFQTSGGGDGANQNPPRDPPAEIIGDDIASRLKRAQQAEREQYRVWREAIAMNDGGAQSVALRNHKDALRNLTELETLLIESRKETGETVDLPFAQKLIDDRLAPFRGALHSLDRVLASELFPEDSARHRPRVRAVIARHFLSAIANAKRRIFTAPSAAPSTSDGRAAIAA